MHEIIPMLINSTVCECLCVQYRRCVRVKAAARAGDSRGEVALTSGGIQARLLPGYQIKTRAS